ncbi:ankyrin repeat domain-containing protein [Paenibacillus oleatilyticus]|uniref:ankyrin repeat domain-containing protein n=1 Tax=Paenibacillus oleatilyticus TaxID=2594886 RepID=UPI001C1F9F9F|nr:ankyrin repeat domain-containing protein [Paenibacillus oleatilyticus]MBU7314337.1 ankyrin repeat domain-containing protein [Paenibacillus oleatilyticus]
MGPNSEDIKNGNINRIVELLENGMDVNEEIVVGNSKELPINYALENRQFDIVRLLADNGAILNDESNPVIVTAARYGNEEIIRYLLSKGADINATNRFESSALEEAISWNNDIDLKIFVDSGIDMNKHGGKALRGAAFDGNLQVIQFLVREGANINYCGSGLHSNPTPLHVAVSKGHTAIVDFLLENGADLSIQDRYGARPYVCAKEAKNDLLASKIKLLEPIEWHDAHKRKEELISMGLRKEIVDFLGTENKTIQLKESTCAEFVEFRTIFEVTAFRWKDYVVLDLLREVEGYDALGVLLWVPEEDKFAFLDVDHEQFGFIPDLTWDEFINNSAVYIDGILTGEYEEDSEDEWY